MPRITLTAPNQTPQPYSLSLRRQQVSLGRASDNDIVIPCPSVSLHHAVMERVPGGFQLRDLGSTNGTKLAGTAETLIPLKDGLDVQLGDVDLSFVYEAGEVEELAAEVRDASDGAQAPVEAAPESAAAATADAAVPAPPESATSANPTRQLLARCVVGVLCVAAFGLGLSIRYAQKYPGQVFLKDLRATFFSEPAPPR
jgi:pSer/pThr/pTyr-binding forkhead associated (FHA) protein